MKIILNKKEIVDMGLWFKIADLLGLDYYAADRIPDEEAFIITMEQAKELGLLDNKEQ